MVDVQDNRQLEEPKLLSQPGPNKGKIGIDISNQMISYECCLCKDFILYSKLSIAILFEMALTNAWLIYKKVTKKHYQ